ncbi:MAG: anti-CBASS protein Acb1 family protein, partial [Brevundimonas sp.]
MSLLRLVVNNATRRLGSMFPAYFGNQKHHHARDFGYPEHVEFGLLWEAYRRNPLARAAVDKTVGKTWETLPYLQEFARDDGDDAPETTIEKAIRQRLADIRGWQVMMEADRRAMVGGYAGVILRIADDRRFDEPVDSVRGGIDALVEIIPAWKGQLEVSEWDTDQASVTYGQPKMFQFNEASVGDGRSQPRQFQLHPDRVVIWSEDGTVHARSALEPGYNALLDLDKIRGAGGEGFWKNAKSAPVLEVDATTDIQQMAKAMGISPDEVLEKMNAQVEDWQKGFDQLLMLQGMKADTLQVQLPSPEHFFAIALQSFAASVQVPLKILVGSQTGERASTEDADEWARVNMARRTNLVV